MCKGNCGKCKKAEFETTDVQVESLGRCSGMIVDDGWNGEGFPPVGTKCGVFFSRDNNPLWHECEVMYLSRSTMVLKFDDEELAYEEREWNDIKFCPLKKLEELNGRSKVIVDGGISNGDLCIARSIFGNRALTFIGMADGLDYQNDCVVVKGGQPIPILYSELEKA